MPYVGSLNRIKKNVGLRERRQLLNLEKVDGKKHLQGREWDLSIMQFERCVKLHRAVFGTEERIRHRVKEKYADE